METFALYLIKSTVWLTGFFLIYIAFLRNERFFVLNRIYLVSGILVSIVFPLFTWHYTVVFPVTPTAEALEPQVLGATTVSEPFPIQNLLLYFYLTGALYLLFRLIKQTLSVWKVIRNSETHRFNSVKLIRTDRYPASFSFFSFVFVNPSIDKTETNEIVNHEQEHIRQQHWMDLLLFEILRTMHWFNPVSWLYGRLIRQNHEYLADERALQRSSNPAIYRAALLNQMFGGPVISLANSFNYSINKKRFNMMKQITYSPFRKLKLLLVLPLMAGVFYAFAAPEYKFMQAENESGTTEAVVSQQNNINSEVPATQANSLQSQPNNNVSTTLPTDGKIIKGKVITEDGNPLQGTSIVISGTTIGTVSDANGNFELKVTNDSPVVFSFVGYQTKMVKPDFAIETFKMLVTMKTQVVGIDMGDETKPKANPAKSDEKIDLNHTDALILVDGKEITKAEMDKIEPNKIDHVDVLLNNSVKNKENIEKKYGKKGKNGVVLITLKKEQASGTEKKVDDITVSGYAKNENTNLFDQVKSGINIRSTGTSGDLNRPLIVINGIIAVNQNMDKIDPETIESISVFKNESATAIYGDKGKNGVVSITLKKDKSINQNTPIDVKVTGYANDQKNNPAKSTIIEKRNGFGYEYYFGEKQPLLVIDGIVSTSKKMHDIAPETIESIKILKDNEFAITKYGIKGENGVLEITLKKQKEVFVVVEEMPEFPGGVEALRTYVADNLQYPKIALENGIFGQVKVKFVVGANGNIQDVKLSEGLDPSLDQEAIRLVESMPRWKPGTQRGQNVEVAYEIPINFIYPSDYQSISREKLKEKKTK